jgi:hypothetical protein
VINYSDARVMGQSPPVSKSPARPGRAGVAPRWRPGESSTSMTARDALAVSLALMVERAP